jgi:hypothetical protein
MSAGFCIPAFQDQFEEIARLETALRTGEVTGQAAVDALRRLYELMEWQSDGAPLSDVDYLFA